MVTDFIIIAIDGGAASGKSSTARGIAEKLDLLHVDTGSFYRAITRHLLQETPPPHTPETIDACLEKVMLDSPIDQRKTQLEINGTVFPDEALRSPEVNDRVSQFAAMPTIRKLLFDYQQSLAGTARTKGFKGLVMEGRDIGTMIFPDADFKFFLEADSSTREQRRTLEGFSDSIVERDQLDTTRKTAPLVCAPDAIRIDSSNLTLDQVIDHACNIIEA